MLKKLFSRLMILVFIGFFSVTCDLETNQGDLWVKLNSDRCCIMPESTDLYWENIKNSMAVLEEAMKHFTKADG